MLFFYLIYLVGIYVASYFVFIDFFACNLRYVRPWLLGYMHGVYSQCAYY